MREGGEGNGCFNRDVGDELVETIGSLEGNHCQPTLGWSCHVAHSMDARHPIAHRIQEPQLIFHENLEIEGFHLSCRASKCNGDTLCSLEPLGA